MPTDQPEPTSPGADPSHRGPVAGAAGADGAAARRPAPGEPRPAAAPHGAGRAGRYRTPRYGVFLGTGALLGLAVGVALALYGGGDTVTSGAGVLGYFSAFGVIVGGLLGGTLAILVESALNSHHRLRSRRR